MLVFRCLAFPVGVKLDELAVFRRVSVDIQVHVPYAGYGLVQEHCRIPCSLDFLSLHRAALVHEDANGHPVSPDRPLLTVDVLDALDRLGQLAGIQMPAPQPAQVKAPVSAVASQCVGHRGNEPSDS